MTWRRSLDTRACARLKVATFVVVRPQSTATVRGSGYQFVLYRERALSCAPFAYISQSNRSPTLQVLP